MHLFLFALGLMMLHLIGHSTCKGHTRMVLLHLIGQSTCKGHTRIVLLHLIGQSMCKGHIRTVLLRGVVANLFVAEFHRVY